MLKAAGVTDRPGLLHGTRVRFPTEIAPLMPTFIRRADLMPPYEDVFFTYCLKQVAVGDRVFDVGAHFGLLSLLLSHAVGPSGSVVSLEPNWKSAGIFRRLMAANRADNVTLVEKAIGAEPGFVEFNLDDVFSSVSSGNGASGATSKVEMTTVDRVVADTGIQPRVMKVDVEGFELSVFEGARETLSHVDLVFCEVHPQKMREAAGTSPERLFAVLEAAGLALDKPFYPLKHVLDPGRPYNVVFRR